MGYDLSPVNKDVDSFHFGAFSWGPLLDACGYLFPCVRNGGERYCVWGVDARMPEGDDYPRLLSNDGFLVTSEEAKVMARCARNFVAVQRSLPDAHRGSGTTSTQVAFERKDVEELLIRAMSGATPGPWPVKIRDDFTEKYEKFADWAEQSGGFEGVVTWMNGVLHHRLGCLRHGHDDVLVKTPTTLRVRCLRCDRVSPGIAIGDENSRSIQWCCAFCQAWNPINVDRCGQCGRIWRV